MNDDPNALFTEPCIKAIHQAFLFAQKKRYEYVSIDNLIMFIAQTKNGKAIFEAMNLNVEDFKVQVIHYLDENISKLFDIKENPQLTVSTTQTLEQAVTLNKASGSTNLVDEGVILAALFELTIEDSYALNYFKHYKVDRFDIIRFITTGKRKDVIKTTASEDTNNKSFLAKYSIFLNKKAEEGKIDPIIGRTEEIDKVIGIFAQRRKNNPILVGEAGVGKTSIIEGLAKRIVEGQVPESMKDFEIYSLDMPSLVAGTKYRGDFEERLKGVIKEACSNPNIVLFIDEIHNLIGTGATNGTVMDAANILKPALSSGEIKVAGATTAEEYKKYFEKEAALDRRFQQVFVIEPSENEAIEILNGLKDKYADFHHVKYEDGAIEVAVKLTSKYINNKQLPDKAIDAIDMAGAKVKLSNREDKVVRTKDVSEVVAKLARVPVSEIESTEKDKLKFLENSLREEIYGQDSAITQVVDKILLSRANLMSKDKPVGNFLFAGPSGVGKTELAKQIAQKMGIELIRFDMSEYMEKHSVARLVGAPPGYVGYEEGGKLIDAIRKTPHCVLLLDEMEKAHSDIYNILLQVMDYAVLTDSNGNKADFKNVILIMTSNVGAQELNKNVIGFTQIETVDMDREDQVKQRFAPEFYNRLDAVVQFHALENVNIIKVVNKQLKNLKDKLLESKVVAFIDQSVVEYVAQNGFDPKMGARPIERFVEKHIAQPLAREILFGKLDGGGEVRIEINDHKVEFKFLHCYKEEVAREIENNILPDLFKTPKRGRPKKDSKIDSEVSETNSEE